MQNADAVQIPIGLTSAWRLLQRSQRLWRAAAPVWAGQGLLAGMLLFGITLLFPPPGIPFLLAGLLLLSWLAPGFLRTAQRQMRGERIAVSQLFSEKSDFPSMLSLLLLVSLPLWIALIGSAVIGGLSGLAFASITLALDVRSEMGGVVMLAAFLLSAVPSSMIALTFGFLAVPLLVAGGMRPVAAFQRSCVLTFTRARHYFVLTVATEGVLLVTAVAGYLLAEATTLARAAAVALPMALFLPRVFITQAVAYDEIPPARRTIAG